MASDGKPVQIPVTSLVHGSQAPTTVVIRALTAAQAAGATAPASATAAAQASAAQTSAALAGATLAAGTPAGATQTSAPPTGETVHSTSPTALVTFLNKFLNESGRADQFRVDPTSDTNIQEVNPATGEVIAQYSADEFPALARSVGLTGGLVDGHA
jgi:hypothetical protein